MTIRTHRMSFPLSAADARELRAGDQVIIDGEIVATAGMPTHERLLRCLDGAEPLPMKVHGASLFHLGSYSREAGDSLELLYINPTTSTRFNPYMPRLIEGFQFHAVGGKGGLDERSTRAMQAAGCVYLSFSAAVQRCTRGRSAKCSRWAGRTCSCITAWSACASKAWDLSPSASTRTDAAFIRRNRRRPRRACRKSWMTSPPIASAPAPPRPATT